MIASGRQIVLALSLLVLLSQTAFAQHKADEVLVLYNASSPTSTAIANDYSAKRHVTNMLPVRCVDSALNTDNETIQYADYLTEIAAPLSKYLAAHKNINFIVLSKGVPIRINGALTGDNLPGPQQPSLDSYLAAFDYASLPGATKASMAGSGTVGTAWINRYYNATVPFSHAKFGGYLVTRLDGYTIDDAKRLVDESLAAESSVPTGDILFDIEPDFGVGDKTLHPVKFASTVVSTEEPWGDWNADMLRASDMLEANGIPHVTALSKKFIGSMTGLLGYFSWGSNDDGFNSDAYESLTFAPGSISDTAVSTSDRTFLPTTGGQTLMEDLIAHGLTCCQGYVDEPILDGTSSPTIDLSHYLSGMTMAESFYAGSKYVGWEQVCVGDPLCAPFSGKQMVVPVPASTFTDSSGDVKLEPCAESGQDVGFISNRSFTAYSKVNFSGVNEFVARVASGANGAAIELHLDSVSGKLVGICAVPSTDGWQSFVTQTCKLQTAPHGSHKLFLVYIGGPGNLMNIEWFALRKANH